MRLRFGFKARRLRQWLEVVEEEGRQMTAWQVCRMLLQIGCAALRLPLCVPRSVWRARLRQCRRCPLLDRTLWRCRPYSRSDLGCGCYCPFLALEARHCWAWERLPGRGLGW